METINTSSYILHTPTDEELLKRDLEDDSYLFQLLSKRLDGEDVELEDT